MGPRLISRGIASSYAHGREYGAASMGPRLISRGIRFLPSAVRPRGRASMGPRLISRGILDYLFRRGVFATRFNGAAADQPRNREVLSGNEDVLGASMGPRLISRGIPEKHPR